MRCCWATSVFTCTGLNRPTRIICAIPRASLRSVLLICCAVSKAFMCRVSTQITGRSAAVNAFTSHCDSGPASIPIRPKGTPTFLSPTHQDPRNAPSHRSFLDARARTDLDPFIIIEGDARSASKAEPQPPRYTISRAPNKATLIHGHIGSERSSSLSSRTEIPRTNLLLRVDVRLSILPPPLWYLCRAKGRGCRDPKGWF